MGVTINPRPEHADSPVSELVRMLREMERELIGLRLDVLYLKYGPDFSRLKPKIFY